MSRQAILFRKSLGLKANQFTPLKPIILARHPPPPILFRQSFQMITEQMFVFKINEHAVLTFPVPQLYSAAEAL